MILDVVPLQSERSVPVGEEVRLRFRLFDARDMRAPENLGPLRALVFRPADEWQGQCWAHPIGYGLYEVAIPAPGTRTCYLFLADPKSGIGYTQLPHLIFQTSEAGTSAIGRSPDAASAEHQC